MAHARRKFVEAQFIDPVRVCQTIEIIRELYRVEADILETARRQHMARHNLPQDTPLSIIKPDIEFIFNARKCQRQARSVQLLQQLRGWLMKCKDDLLPKNPIAAAVDYSLNNWDALCRYAHNPLLAIDNNPAENALRKVVLGRKNYLFCGSERGGRTAAVHYTMILSAKRCGLEPFAYLADVITRISAHPMSRLYELLPDKWQPQEKRADQRTPAEPVGQLALVRQ